MNFKTVYSAMCKRASQTKSAGPVSDYVASAVNRMIPYVGDVTNLVGGVHGMFGPTGEQAEADAAEMDEHPGRAFIPGVGASRTERRLKQQLVTPDGKSRRFWSANFGPLTSTLLATAAGAGIGGASNGSDGALKGALIGAGASGAANIMAGLIAAVRRRRTAEEQLAAAGSASGTALDYLVPGYANYNAWKSFGRARADAERREQEKGKA